MRTICTIIQLFFKKIFKNLFTDIPLLLRPSFCWAAFFMGEFCLRKAKNVAGEKKRMEIGKAKNRNRQSKEWKRESERMEIRKRKSHVFCSLRPCSWEFRTGRTGRTSQTCPTCPTLLSKQPHIRPVRQVRLVQKTKIPQLPSKQKEQLLTKLLLLFIIFLPKRLAVS